jgi:hypothetical protein
VYRDAEDYLALLRDCSNRALALARDLRLAAEIAPEQSCVAPCINLAAYLEREAASMNPDKPAWPKGPAQIITLEEVRRRKNAEAMEPGD